jgi:large subunit ribosomal protein L9
MKVILQENVANLGKVGDQVNVKAGYARNYLLPQAKAMTATASNIDIFEARRSDLEKQSSERISLARQRADSIKDLNVSIQVKASEEGRLFGSIGPREVAEGIEKAGQKVSKKEVILPEGPIRVTGEHEVRLVFHSEVDVTLKVNIIAES